MKAAIVVLIFGIGFLLGQESIILRYDPAELEKSSRILAANTYMLGCVNAGKTNDDCRVEADLWYRGGDPVGVKPRAGHKCPYLCR